VDVRPHSSVSSPLFRRTPRSRAPPTRARHTLARSHKLCPPTHPHELPCSRTLARPKPTPHTHAPVYPGSAPAHAPFRTPVHAAGPALTRFRDPHTSRTPARPAQLSPASETRTQAAHSHTHRSALSPDLSLHARVPHSPLSLALSRAPLALLTSLSALASFPAASYTSPRDLVAA